MGTPTSFREEQRKDPQLREIIHFLDTDELSADDKRVRKIAVQQSMFTVVDDVLYYIDPKRDHQKRIAVPKQLREQILEEAHRGIMEIYFHCTKSHKTI